MQNYALQFPFLKQFDFIEHYFFIQHLPVEGSAIYDFANVLELPVFEYGSVNQIHSGHVFLFEENPSYEPDGDGIVTAIPNLWIGVHVADCAPVYLIDTLNRVIAVIHCGWRPISEEIIENTLALMAEKFGSAPSEIFAYIGPTIQYSDYEIGPEIAHHFHESSIIQKSEKIYLDIPNEIEFRLMRIGVKGDGIDKFPLSTFSEPAFCSYRRDGVGVLPMTAVVKLK
ncbi:MAG: polyphenol oxidase family protein [Candidatus Zixiibacteriota bacterium]